MKKRPFTYAEQEYGITPAEMKIIARRLYARAKKNLASGKAKTFASGIEALL